MKLNVLVLGSEVFVIAGSNSLCPGITVNVFGPLSKSKMERERKSLLRYLSML
jgi:hypothetical protein